LGRLYFLVASGFTLIFGLMRNVNLAHGSLYLLGGYLGWSVGTATGSWSAALIAAFVVVALAGSHAGPSCSAGWRGRTAARRW
jgi:branched-chain amino acid transport system permease protein